MIDRTSTRRRATQALLVLALVAPALAQDVDPSPTPAEAPLTVAVIDSRVAGLASAELEDAQRESARHAYAQASDLLARAGAADARRVGFEKAAAEAPGKLEQIQAELARPPLEMVLNVPQDARVAVLEEHLESSEALRASAEENLDDLRGAQKRRDARRGELAQLIAAASETQREAREGLAAQSEDQPLALRLARTTLLTAQLQHARAERGALTAEQESYKARNELFPARMDVARRRLGQLEAHVEDWHERVGEARRIEAQLATEEASLLRLEAAVQRVPSLRAVAADNERLAQERSDVDGLAAKMEAATQRLTDTRGELAHLRKSFSTVRRKIEAAGLTNAMARLLRKEYERLPDVVEIERRRRLFEELVSNTQLRLIELDEKREAAGDVEASLLEVLADPAIAREGIDPEDVTSAARRILTSRKETITVLVRDYGGYLIRLLDIGLADRELSEATTAYRDYIEERILWVRSVTGSTLPNPLQATEAAGWLLSPQRVRRAFQAGVDHAWAHPLGPALRLLLLVLCTGAALLAWRRWNKGGGVSFARTVRTLVSTMLIAAPVPLAILLVSYHLASPPDQTEWGLAVGQTLGHVAQVAFCLGVLWVLAAPRGLAVQQFHWRAEPLAHLRRHVLWFTPVALIAILVSVSLDQQETVARSESLGRIAFVLGELGLAVVAQRLFRAGSPLFTDMPKTSLPGRMRRLYYVLLVGGPLGFAALALWGYYYTALRLTRSLEQSLILVGVLIVARALFLRWFLLARRRLQREQAQRRVNSQTTSRPRLGSKDGTEQVDAEEQPEQPEQPEVLPEEELDLAAIKDQIDKLIRSVLVVTAAVGMLWIWADVLPALKRLDQVHLYPEVHVVEASEPSLHEILVNEPPPVTDGGEAPAASPAAALPLGPALPAAKAATSGIGVVTLADILLAILVLVMTIVASRNVPGLLEVALLQHLPVDAGARYAVITIVRYLIVITGVWACAGAVGITWASIQWLAAALTFGLAFGLQEIFANFVSGLIIFGERPVNIGDVVTVGTVTGRVSRIRIRAITIVDLDRKELIVPNREFVTGHVINWTLSDNVLRVVIPLGVAYGTDAARVRELLVGVADEHPKVLTDPAPGAFFVGFGASSLDFELRAFVSGFDTLLEVRTDLLQRIQAALAKAQIEIPFPQRDLNLKAGQGLRQVMQAVSLSPASVQPLALETATPQPAKPEAEKAEAED